MPFRAALEKARNRAERFPGVLKAARAATEALQARLERFCPAKIALESIERVRFAKSEAGAASAVIDLGKERGRPGAHVLIGDDAVATVIWAMCGGGAQGRPARRPGPLGAVECALLRLVAGEIAATFASAFQPQLPGFGFAVVDLTTPGSGVFEPPAPLDAFALRLSLRLRERRAELVVLLPASAFRLAPEAPDQPRGDGAPTRQGLPAPPAGRGGVEHALLNVEVVLAETEVTISGLSALEKGVTLPLGVEAGSTVVLECGGTRLATGRIGKRAGRLVVEIVTVGEAVHPGGG